MKDTIRLTKRNKERLSPYDDDANKAIDYLFMEKEAFRIKIESVDSVQSMILNALEAPIDKTPGVFSSDCHSPVAVSSATDTVYCRGPKTVAHTSGSAAVPARDRWLAKSQVAPDGGLKMCDVSENEFWKRMKRELDTTIQGFGGAWH
jgi:hypothetical protein